MTLSTTLVPQGQLIQPYVAMHLEHFPQGVFKEGIAEIYPMWSGEGNLSYLVLNTETREAVLIDPDIEILGSYLLTLDKQELTLKAVIDTHNHAEHATACPVLRQLFDVPFIMHEKARSSFITDKVMGSDSRMIVGLNFEFLYTPGHTPCMMTVKLGQHLFTGDSLFGKACGRADLPGGDAGEQFDSLNRLAALGDSMVIHPGHDYNNELSATVAEAKAQNKRLQFATKAEFVSFMETHYLTNEKPDDLHYYVAFNAR